MMKMQKLILTILTLTAVMAQAKTQIKTKDAVCATCAQNEKMVKELKKLDANKEKERFKGEAMATRTSDSLVAFQQLPATAPGRDQTFKSLLSVAREASPFDTESQVAQILADLVKKDAGLKKLYEGFVKDMPKAAKTADFCKSQNFETSVTTQSCRIDVENDKKLSQAKRDEKLMACTSSFDYADCLKTAKK